MLNLLLMRHAKSDWSLPSSGDHERVLNQRGTLAAPLMGRWLVQQDCLPDFIRCSTAIRTRQTVELMLPELGVPRHEANCVFDEQLYLPSPSKILQSIGQFPERCATGMIVAHNPGLAQFLAEVTRDYLHLPTAAIAFLQSDVQAWDIALTDPRRFVQSLSLKNFWCPKDEAIANL